MSKRTFVILGASLAGAKAAQELRERGFDGRIVMVGFERERPYERPPLTKDYLRGESEREKVYVHPPGYYEEHEIELLPDVTATAIDPKASRVVLEGDRELAYDRLLLSTGAEPRRIPVAGAELEGVYYLRTLDDCDALRARLDLGGRVVVVGAGWIGSEFAASARQRGVEVTVIDPVALPNERVFGAEIGAFYRDVHVRHGVRMLLGRGVHAFEGREAVERVRADDGTIVECDFAVVGIGTRRATRSPARRGSRSTTASSSTSAWPPQRPTSSPRATWRTPGIRSTRDRSGSSTGPTRSIRGRRRRTQCSARR